MWAAGICLGKYIIICRLLISENHPYCQILMHVAKHAPWFTKICSAKHALFQAVVLWEIMSLMYQRNNFVVKHVHAAYFGNYMTPFSFPIARGIVASVFITSTTQSFVWKPSWLVVSSGESETPGPNHHHHHPVVQTYLMHLDYQLLPQNMTCRRPTIATAVTRINHWIPWFLLNDKIWGPIMWYK